MSFLSFVCVYLVVGGLKKTLIVPAVFIVWVKWVASFESQESQLSKDI